MESFKEYYTLLVEGRKNRYREIFSWIDDIPDHINSINKDYIWNTVENQIQYSIREFHREDRIIWYLRILNYRYLMSVVGRLTNGGYDKEPIKQKLIDRSTNLLKKFAYVADTHSSPTQSLGHYMDLRDQIPEIDQVVFHDQETGYLARKFNEIEREWFSGIGDSEQIINITQELADGDIETLIEFDDGFQWMDLKRTGCPEEGDAMGHCGNGGGYSNTLTVLSLRKITKKRDNILARPSLTFILDRGREGETLLGEMKGRGNKKPNPKYHDHILSLLLFKKDGEDFYIDGVVGGGYLPEENFSLTDLSEERREHLFKLRPELADIPWLIKEGRKDEVDKRLTEGCDYAFERGSYLGLDTNKEGKVIGINIKMFDDVDDIVQNSGKPNMEAYKETLSNGHFDIWDLKLEDHHVSHIWDELSEEEQTKLITYAEENGWDEEATGNGIESDIELKETGCEDIHNAMSTALLYAAESGTMSELSKAVVSWINECDFVIGVGEMNDNAIETTLNTTKDGKGETLWDQPVYATLHPTDISLLESTDWNVYETVIESDLTIPYNGFDGFDWDYLTEAFKESMGEFT